MSLQRKAEISILLLYMGYMGFRDLIPCRNIDGLSSGLENQTSTKHSLLLAGGLNVPVTLGKLQLKSLI